MSENTSSTPVPNISQNAVSGIDAEPLTPREPSHLAGHPSNRRYDVEDVDLGPAKTDEDAGEEELRGEALDQAVRDANEAGAGIKVSGTADEKRAALAEYEQSKA